MKILKVNEGFNTNHSCYGSLILFIMIEERLDSSDMGLVIPYGKDSDYYDVKYSQILEELSCCYVKKEEY